MTYRPLSTRIGDALGPLEPIWDAWLLGVAALSWLLARVLLTLVFFTGFLAYGVVLRVLRRDPMRRTIDDRDSYWGDNVVAIDNVEEFETLY